MKKLFLFSLVLSVIMLFTEGITPLQAGATMTSAFLTDGDVALTMVQSDSQQTLKLKDITNLALDEERVSFLLACRCTPDKLPW